MSTIHHFVFGGGKAAQQIKNTIMALLHKCHPFNLYFVKGKIIPLSTIQKVEFLNMLIEE